MNEANYLLSSTNAYNALSETARSLSRSLQAAPVQEPKRAASLRQWLMAIANSLVVECETTPFKPDRAKAFTELLDNLRGLAAEINVGAPLIPPGIYLVLHAFLEKLSPRGYLLMRPGQSVYYGEEFLQTLRENLTQANLHVPEPAEMPKQVFVFHYPQGEQDNVLTCCVLLRNLYQARYPDAPIPLSSGLAAWALGPAYFFALIAMTETAAGGDATRYRIPIRASRVLEASGWFQHPQMAPLLKTLRDRFETFENAFDPTQSPQWEALTSQVPPYTPDDYDRDAHRLWERLRQLLPPNELEINAIESTHPADLASILNAGWSFYLLHIQDLYQILGSRTSEDRYDAKLVLNRLLTKGVELSQISQRWSEARRATEL
jgi:hypothetical protein